MDVAAVKEAKDEELQTIGLTSRGDILTLRAFTETVNKTAVVDRKRSLLRSLKEKIAAQRLSKKKKTETTKEIPKGRRKTLFKKIRVGWQHFDKKQKRYISIRLVNGGGTRDVDVALNATKIEIIEQLKTIFFPEGKNAFGKISEMRFSLGNFQCEEVTDEGFTLGQYITRYRLSRCRLYLMSKLYDDLFPDDIISDSDYDLPLSNVSVSENTSYYPSQLTTNLIGTCSERNSLLEEQNEELNISLAKDQMKIKPIQHEKEVEEEHSLKLRAAKVPVEPSLDEEHVTVSVRHISIGNQTRRFATDCKIASIYHWVGSLSFYPTNFILSTCDMAYLDPHLLVTMVDKTLIRMSENVEVDLEDKKFKNNETLSFQNRSCFTLPIPTERPPEILLVDDDV